MEVHLNKKSIEEILWKASQQNKNWMSIVCACMCMCAQSGRIHLFYKNCECQTLNVSKSHSHIRKHKSRCGMYFLLSFYFFLRALFPAAITSAHFSTVKKSNISRFSQCQQTLSDLFESNSQTDKHLFICFCLCENKKTHEPKTHNILFAMCRLRRVSFVYFVLACWISDKT